MRPVPFTIISSIQFNGNDDGILLGRNHLSRKHLIENPKLLSVTSRYFRPSSNHRGMRSGDSAMPTSTRRSVANYDFRAEAKVQLCMPLGGRNLSPAD